MFFFFHLFIPINNIRIIMIYLVQTLKFQLNTLPVLKKSFGTLNTIVLLRLTCIYSLKKNHHYAYEKKLLI